MGLIFLKINFDYFVTLLYYRSFFFYIFVVPILVCIVVVTHNVTDTWDER